MSSTTEPAPDWYLAHFIRMGHSVEHLNTVWAGLSEADRAAYARSLEHRTRDGATDV